MAKTEYTTLNLPKTLVDDTPYNLDLILLQHS